MEYYDVVILGGGPAGLAASLSAKQNNASTLIIERENRLGGILKQCIHDGFGLIRFNEKLSGPEYAERYIRMVNKAEIPVKLSTFVTNVEEFKDSFQLTIVNSQDGMNKIESKSIILANGCRERTAKQIFIHGTRPSGVYSAGTAQYFVNILGCLPCKKCVILGSGDIGLIMARRLTLEGAEVVGVYEAKSIPSGLTRNIAQCLDDYNIPLFLSHTITRVIGDDRVEAVEIAKVDLHMNPIKGTEQLIECDGVILSVGLIPENEIAESLNIDIDSLTKGPFIDQDFMTLKDRVFSCGNALHVNDLVDYVSESGKYAGSNAASVNHSIPARTLIPIVKDTQDFLYVVPQYININSNNKRIVVYFRSSNIRDDMTIKLKCDGTIIFSKRYKTLKPPEMERIEFDISSVSLNKESKLRIVMEANKK
ncbi:NAD(P)/FAD-dependent oxidoreductase [Brassicibacter mesophilus]|uniref:NAD(P)/FAD-dependent oxidoreductase n=1 Tax=Brassicibacter mesophilus TaxID=745119 RepID=UPI003D19F7C6